MLKVYLCGTVLACSIRLTVTQTVSMSENLAYQESSKQHISGDGRNFMDSLSACIASSQSNCTLSVVKGGRN